MRLSEAAVLIVDDEPILLDIFSKWMLKAGCGEVHTAANGVEALEVIATTRINLLVTDVRMPLMDGVSLVRCIAARGLFVPGVIFVSGFGDVDMREMYGLGVESFLTKPFKLDALMEAVTRALAEPSALWLTPMETAPKQTMTIEVAGAMGVENESIRLGQGGFSARYREPLTLGRVNFRCCLQAEERELIGQGFVRWRSKTDETVGVEFAYLETSDRAWLLEQMDRVAKVTYIPSF